MDDEELARLLSGRNRPSILAKEAEADQLLARLQRERRARRTWLAGGVLAAAAALALAYVRLDSTDSSLTPRGTPARPAFLARCGAEHVSCRVGDTLAFEIVARAGHEYFAAFAQRNDGAVLWYLPTPDGRSERVTRDGALLQVGVKLGPEHVAGTYRVLGIFSSAPMSRADLRERLGPDLRGRTGIDVVETALRVEPTP